MLALPAENTVLLVGKDGDGEWQALRPDDTGFASLEVTSGRYGYAYACERASLPPRVRVRFATPENNPPSALCVPSTIPPPTFTITGTTAPNARVVVGDDVNGSAAVADGTGAYELPFVGAGVHDVVAVLDGTPAKLLIVRDIDVAADRILDLPIATSGVDLVMLTPTVIGAGGESVMLFSELWTANKTRVDLGSGATAVPVPPPGSLVTDDAASIRASAQTADGVRLVQRALVTQPALEIPAAIGATVDQTEVRWGGEWEFIQLLFMPRVFNTRLWGIDYAASRAWVAANGDPALVLVDVRTLPGWTDAIPVAEPGEAGMWQLAGSTGDIVGDYEVSSAEGEIVF